MSETASDKPTDPDDSSASRHEPVDSATSATTTTTSKPKVDILLKPAGDAPIMKKKKWAVERCKKIGMVSQFIKKYIKSEPSESLFLYVNQSFAPSPDTEVGTVYDCFGSDGKLVLHYCKTQAWG